MVTSPPTSAALGWRYSAKPTSTAARPTKLLSKATISGISVIATRAAASTPTKTPSPMELIWIG